MGSSPLMGAGGAGGGDIELGGAGGGGGTSAFMQTFFDDAQEIKKTMASIRYNIRQIEQSHGECLTAISAEQGRESTEKLEELMRTTNGMATQVRHAQDTRPRARGGRGAARAALHVSSCSSTVTFARCACAC